MKRIPVIVFGVGGVGQALLRQIWDGRARVAARAQCRFDVVALADSRGWLCNVDGLTDEQLQTAVAGKQAGHPVGKERPSALEILTHIHDAGLKDLLVVDVTAESGMEPVLDFALEQGDSIVLANKKALAGPWSTAQSYFNHPRVRHESTVGGGQPVIATMRYLLDTNDPIFEIEGQLSGTLGFICTCLDKNMPFSQAVAEAKASGFTEPDPREDLGGQDVMRKVMILGRMAGWPLEAADIEVESLYPAEMANMPAAEFMSAVSELNEGMGQRIQAARAKRTLLRYIARLSQKGGEIGLTRVPEGSPLANMKYISFRTARYNDEPLLIGGKGAGVEMTAAGVLGDMISLVRET